MNGSPKPPRGQGHAKAWVQTGFREIGRYLYAFPENPGPVEHPGLFGNSTQAETNQSKGFDERTQEASYKSTYQQSAQKEPGLER